MEPLIRVFSQHQPGAQTRRLLRLRELLFRRALGTASKLWLRPTIILFETLNLANRLKIHLRICSVPTSQQIATESLIGARPLHLIENEFVIIFDRFDDLSELAHGISPLIGSPFGAPGGRSLPSS